MRRRRRDHKIQNKEIKKEKEKEEEGGRDENPTCMMREEVTIGVIPSSIKVPLLEAMITLNQ